MPVRLSSIASLVAVTLGASLAASAAPTIDPPANCPKPTLATCSNTPPLSPCATVHRDACNNLLKDAWQNLPARATAETRTMLRPVVAPEMPQNLRQGTFFPYKPAAKKLVARPRASKLTVLGALQRTGPIAPVHPPKPGHRKPEWEANGARVASCEEYAYESIYDWVRFLDSAALCDGNADCVMDLAYQPTAPGIAGRELKRIDGVKLEHQPALFKGGLAKNLMYALGSDIRTGGLKLIVPDSPEALGLAAMKKDLQKGRVWRAIACPAGECRDAEENYADEWAYHTAMRQRLAPVGIEEREEYARRRDGFHKLHAKWAAQVKAEKDGVAGKLDQLKPKKVDLLPVERMPWDDILDPLVRIRAIERFDASLVGAAKKAGKNVPVLQNILQPAPSLGLGFVAPPPMQGPSQDPPAHDCSNFAGSPAGDVDPRACRLAGFMRDEWWRQQRGQKSCLDPDNHECDWSPEMFRDRVFALGEPYLNQQQRLYDHCLAVTRTGKLKEQPIGEVAKHLEDIAKSNAEALKKLEPYRYPGTNSVGGLRFGTSKGDGDSWGDTGMFAAGYAYHYGWSVEPNETRDGQACSLEGETNNTLNLDAHVLSKRISLLDAGLTSTANRAKNNRVTLDMHLRLLGIDMFPEVKNDNITQLFNQTNQTTKPTPRAEFNFMAGPVPVGIAAWGQLSLGYRLRAAGKFGPCSADGPSFGLTAEFAPETAVDAVVQAGVGIQGFASAGIRGTLNLIRVGFPLTAAFEMVLEKMGNTPMPVLRFHADLALTLATLAGRVALYIEFLFFEDEWEIFSWPGVGPHRIELMKLLDVKLPVSGMLG